MDEKKSGKQGRCRKLLEQKNFRVTDLFLGLPMQHKHKRRLPKMQTAEIVKGKMYRWKRKAFAF
jgi:hypothetical protein